MIIKMLYLVVYVIVYVYDFLFFLSWKNRIVRKIFFGINFLLECEIERERERRKKNIIDRKVFTLNAQNVKTH